MPIFTPLLAYNGIYIDQIHLLFLGESVRKFSNRQYVKCSPYFDYF